MESGFRLTVLNIHLHNEWIIEENLLSLGLANTVFLDAFSGVTVVPIEAADLVPVYHCLYIINIYIYCPVLMREVGVYRHYLQTRTPFEY